MRLTLLSSISTPSPGPVGTRVMPLSISIGLLRMSTPITQVDV